MATRTRIADKVDIATFVDGKAVVLILDDAILDGESLTCGADIEAIGVVAGCVTVGGAVGVVSSGCTKRSVPFKVTD